MSAHRVKCPISKRHSLAVICAVSLVFNSCGTSAINLSNYVYQDKGWACTSGTNSATTYMTLAAAVGFIFDMTIGILVFRFFIRKAHKNWLVICLGFAIFLYSICTIVISLQYVWLTDRMIRCEYDFSIAGKKLISGYRYVSSEKQSTQKSGMEAAAHCEQAKGRLLNPGDSALVKQLLRERNETLIILENQTEKYSLFQMTQDSLRETEGTGFRRAYCLLP